jgi:hypothetical protein
LFFASGGGGGGVKTASKATYSPAVKQAPAEISSPIVSTPQDNYSSPPETTAPAAPVAALPKAIAQWDFTAETEEEVSFKAGDVILLHEYLEEEEWWKGEVNGEVGLFPSAYCKRE